MGSLSNFNFSLCNERLLHLLKHCSRIRSLDTTKSLHALCITLGQNVNQPMYLYNNIISFYASIGHLLMAHQVFDKMLERNVVSFNSMFGAYSRSCALELFSQMRDCGILPTPFTMGGLLSCQYSIQNSSLFLSNSASS